MSAGRRRSRSCYMQKHVTVMHILRSSELICHGVMWKIMSVSHGVIKQRRQPASCHPSKFSEEKCPMTPPPHEWLWKRSVCLMALLDVTKKYSTVMTLTASDISFSWMSLTTVWTYLSPLSIKAIWHHFLEVCLNTWFRVVFFCLFVLFLLLL